VAGRLDMALSGRRVEPQRRAHSSPTVLPSDVVPGKYQSAKARFTTTIRLLDAVRSARWRGRSGWRSRARVRRPAAVIITKARLFTASNSTLYYEQAVRQMNFLISVGAIELPVRLVGLTLAPDIPTDAVFTRYHAPRYSRTVVERGTVRCVVRSGRLPNGRCRIEAVAEDEGLED